MSTDRPTEDTQRLPRHVRRQQARDAAQPLRARFLGIPNRVIKNHRYLARQKLNHSPSAADAS